MPCAHSLSRSSRAGVWALALVVITLLAGCGGETPVADGDDPWPLRVPVPGVVGYAAVTLEVEGVRTLVESALGAVPLALAGGRVVVLGLDPLALGGAAAMVLPLEDEEAFLASLELLPQVESIGDGRYRLSLAANSGLALVLAAWNTFQAEPSALGMLGAVGGLGDQSLTVYVAARDGRAYVVPTFEGVATVRRACAALTGLAEPQQWVASVDVERFVTAHHDALENTRQRVLAAVGAAGGLVGRHRSDDVAGMRAVLFERLREALLTFQFDGGGILGLQARAQVEPFAASPQAVQEQLAEHVSDFEWRLSWNKGARLGSLLEALRPVPADTGFAFMARIDPQARTESLVGGSLADAGLGWLGLPGGPSGDAALAAFEKVVAALGDGDGLIAVPHTESPEQTCMLLSLDPGGQVDWPRLVDAVFEMLPPELGRSVQLVAGPQGDVILLDEHGAPQFSAGVSNDVAWFGSGERAGPPLESCQALNRLARNLPADGPVLRLGSQARVAELRVTGREAKLHIDVSGESGRGR